MQDPESDKRRNLKGWMLKSLLWNEDVDRKHKITIFIVFFKRYYCMEQVRGHVLREGKVTTWRRGAIFAGSSRKNEAR